MPEIPGKLKITFHRNRNSADGKPRLAANSHKLIQIRLFRSSGADIPPLLSPLRDGVVRDLIAEILPHLSHRHLRELLSLTVRYLKHPGYAEISRQYQTHRIGPDSPRRPLKSLFPSGKGISLPLELYTLGLRNGRVFSRFARSH